MQNVNLWGQSTGAGRSRCAIALGDKREHSFASTGVVRELLAVSLVLLDGPEVHLANSNDKEEVGGPGLGQDRHCEPSQGLEKVVGARHPIKSIAAGDLADASAWGTEVAQSDVGEVVGDLGKDEQGNAAVDQGFTALAQRGASSVPGAIDPVGEIETGEEMVVGRVLEQVAEGHGAVREAVDKHGLVLALQEVQHHHDESDAKSCEIIQVPQLDTPCSHAPVGLSTLVSFMKKSDLQLHGAVLKSLSVEQGREVVDERVDDQGTAVLDQEHGCPAQLGT